MHFECKITEQSDRSAEADSPVPAERTHGQGQRGRAGWSARVSGTRAISLGGGSPPPAGPRSDSRQRRVFPAPRSLTRSPDSHAPQLQPLQAGPKCPHASSLKSHTAAPRPKFRSRCLPAQARRRRVLPGKRASGGLPPCGPAGRRPGEASRASPEVGGGVGSPANAAPVVAVLCPLNWRCFKFGDKYRCDLARAQTCLGVHGTRRGSPRRQRRRPVDRWLPPAPHEAARAGLGALPRGTRLLPDSSHMGRRGWVILPGTDLSF